MSANRPPSETGSSTAFAWEIRTTEDKDFGTLTPQAIGQGLRDGWLRLDDSARRGESPWGTIQSEASKMGFHVQVYTDTARAYGNWYAMLATMAFALAGASVFTAYLSVTLLGKSIGWGILYGAGALLVVPLALIVAERVGLALWRGCLTVLIGIALWSLIMGVPMSGFSDSFFRAMLPGLPIAALVAGALGYTPGYWLGKAVGKRRQANYRTPEARQPPPSSVQA